MWLTTYDTHGYPHVMRSDEQHLHFRVSRRVWCRCNPRVRGGVVVHRTLSRVALYTPLKGRGH
jgi:hypothetical protein